MHVSYRIAVATVALFCVAGGSAGRIIHQQGRAFSVEAITVARGESIVFLNDDTVPHNIMSITPDNAFDLGSQIPGRATPVSFNKAGIVAVICAIHPRMHMTITVSD